MNRMDMLLVIKLNNEILVIFNCRIASKLKSTVDFKKLKEKKNILVFKLAL